MSKLTKTGTPQAAPDDKSPAGDTIANTLFKKLIENSHDGIALLNRNFEVIYRSASAERINGWNNESRAKYKLDDLVHPEDREGLRTTLSKVLISPGIPETINFRAKHLYGHYNWLECTYTNFFDDPDINAIVCNFRDITRQKQDEELLQQTVQELFAYQYAIDESSIMAITDQKGIIKHVNDNFCKISKYSREELIGQDYRIINAGYHDKTYIHNLWTAIAQGKIWKGELKNKAKDGSYYWVDTTIVPFLNEHGKAYQYVAIHADITERRRVQEKIIENARFLKTITDNLPAMIAYFNSELYCLFANKPYMEWFEKKPHEILGVSKRDILDKGEFELHEAHIREVLKGNPQRFERTFHKADGRAIDTDTQYLPDTGDGRINGFYSLIYDVTAVKRAEVEIKEKTGQIKDILENITDGFIALDQNMCYTYANREIGVILGLDPKTLIGKNVWELFPEAVGTPTYEAMQTALNEKRMVCNEDYSGPINMWQENRVYPSGNGISMFIRDITRKKQEEQHLKLLESVITNTTDAVLITEAEPLDEPGPRVLYVNEAFTKMTGYAADEIIGKTPRVLQGPKSSMAELKRLSDAMGNRQHCEVTIINYKKNGEEFWINFAVNPVINGQGHCTHFIAIERDVTERKNEELQKALLSEISLIFNEAAELNETLGKVLERLLEFTNFGMAEAWLIGVDKNKIQLAARMPRTPEMQAFYDESSEIKSFVKGEGLPGFVWETQTVQFWRDVDKDSRFARRVAAKKVGLKTIYGIPLKHNAEIIGAILLGSTMADKKDHVQNKLIWNFSDYLGAEIKRKQLEHELNQIFNFAPDIICIAGADGYFKKVNPAMCALFEYDEDELLSRPYIEFVHPDDRQQTVTEVNNVFDNKPSQNFENRYITQSGKIKTLAWTATGASDENLLFCVAKDITEKKELEDLFNKAITLARIGSWEVDLANNAVFWSDMTREIHEAEAGYHPDIPAAINFYKEGPDRETIVKTMENAIHNCVPGDVELQIVTAKGNTKWVRVIVEAEFSGGSCKRIYGSFQDIDVRKKAEIASIEALEERNTILESIDDAFFAVDKNWIVTYWNNTAEKLFNTAKAEIINRSLLEKFPGWVGSNAYLQYCEVINTGKALRFEQKSIVFDFWLEISAYPAENGLTVYVKDITGRKSAELAAAEAFEEKNTILESIDDAFFAVDKNWIVTYWNKAAERLTRMPVARILNQAMWEVFADAIGSESYKKYHEAMQTKQAVRFEDYYAPVNMWYEISAYPSDVGLSVYFKDISDRKLSDRLLKELNASLQKQASELAISNAELEQFAYVASHDLQEPLRMVTSFLTQLEKKYSDVVDDKGRQYIYYAVDGAKRMRQIILDLLDFSRVGRTEEDLDEVDLNKVVGEIEGLYRRQIEDLGATVSYKHLPVLTTIKTPIRQVFQNLIGNSLKYHSTDRKPHISITSKDRGNQVEVVVKDNGIGIAKEYFEKIFIIFQRLHNKEQYSGTGMGLAITKKIVENMGGKIWLESEEGKGSTFHFTLIKKQHK